MQRAIFHNFLGSSPNWYKFLIVGFLVLNPLALWTLGTFITGWILVLEFIFTLAMALRCYPLQPGGLLALEALLLGMSSPEHVLQEIIHNIEVILLLMFMVTSIYFMRDLLLFIFTRLLLSVRSKRLLSLLFCGAAAVLSAFLDALTVTAVLIAVVTGFYQVYQKSLAAQPEKFQGEYGAVLALEKEQDLAKFRLFLCDLVMHGLVGTALGGVSTLVGEPQNLLIAKRLDWNFIEFYLQMAPVSMPVLGIGLVTCFLLEVTGLFGYGVQLPESARQVMQRHYKEQQEHFGVREQTLLITQAIIALILVFSLAFHIAAVGLIGLTIIVLLTSFTGVVEERKLAPAFEEAMPFTALLVVFFAIVAVIADQGLFSPVMQWALSMEGEQRTGTLFIASGILSMVSDNVFVGTVYINELAKNHADGIINRADFERLGVAINAGTNIPSVATPNGQAAFLFMLTSGLAPMIRLSYLRMVWMALPYTVMLSTMAFIALLTIL